MQQQVDAYDYVDVECVDGLWRMREDETHEDGGQWHQHLTPKGVTVRSFYQHGDEIVAGRFRVQAGSLEFRLKKSVQYGAPWSGKIYVHDAAEAVARGIAGVAIPSKDVRERSSRSPPSTKRPTPSRSTTSCGWMRRTTS